MASYQYAHYVFRVMGHFGPDATTRRDFWSTGLRIGLAGNDVPISGGMLSFLESVATPTQTWHQDPANWGGNTCWLDELTIARVGTNGKYNPTTQETTRYPYIPPQQAPNSPTHPWNTACVISLRTLIPRGIGSNGRTYWPALRAPIDTGTGRIGSAQLSAWLAAARTWINAVNTAANSHLGAGQGVCVFGQAGVTGPARTAAVVQIRADDRLDTIEKRENDQAPAYQVQSIP